MIYKVSEKQMVELKGLPPSARVKTEWKNNIGIVEIQGEEPCSGFSAEWRIPQEDIQFRWVADAGKIGIGYPQFLPPNWFSKTTSQLCCRVPVFSLVGADSGNRMTAAVSESVLPVEFQSGISEYSFQAECRIVFPAFLRPFRVQIRLDLRKIPFSETLHDVAAWWAAMPEYAPMPVPETALEPLYSTWYSYHHEITPEAVEQEARLGFDDGLRTMIVDDGWQKICGAGSYASAGEWIPADRFSDLKEHVRRVQAMGMRYLMWVALPFLGEDSPLFPSMKGKLLYFSKGLNTWVVDPRFPEVRSRLIERCRQLVETFRLDGLKIDFLDRFPVPSDCVDPAIAEEFAGRDCKSVDRAVYRLLEELCRELRAIRPEILIEFRQDYNAPAMRHFANMFRASDCPGDRIANHRRIINLRLLAGNTAVHSDMLGWCPEESAPSAARQLWNIVFSVPQISVRLAELSPEHRRMLRSWIAFWRKNRDLFLAESLTPLHPELNYPMVTVENESSAAAVVYAENQTVRWTCGKKRFLIVNASASEEVVLEVDGEKQRAAVFDCFGDLTGEIPLHPGLQKICIPCSGYLETH